MAKMATFSIQSGSNGNCYYVEAGDTRLLFDAGVNRKNTVARLAKHDRKLADIHALFITHEHSDHIGHLTSFTRQLAIPTYLTPQTWRAYCGEQKTLQKPKQLSLPFGKSNDKNNVFSWRSVHHFSAGETVQVNQVAVHTFSVPHDAVDTVNYVIEFEGTRLGIFTDLGHPFPKLLQWMQSVDAAYLESNHDEKMLHDSRYPDLLKERIAGPGGHLSNRESAELVESAANRRMQWIALCHLSQENNTPEIALATHHQQVGKSFPYRIAHRYGESPWWEVVEHP